MMPTSTEWEYFRPNENDMSIHGMERMLDNGTAIDVIAYGTFEAPGEFSWMIREWNDATGYTVHASYDSDVYFDDIESAYDDLVGVLARQFPHLVERDEIVREPVRAKSRFFARIAAIGLAAALVLPTLAGCAGGMAYASGPDCTDVALGSCSGAVTYSQLVDDAQYEQYAAYVDIMASGEIAEEGGSGAGWYDGDFEYDELSIDVLNYATYDNPMYSMYKTGADSGIGVSVNTVNGDVRIYSNATKQGDNFNAMYAQVDVVANQMIAQAESYAQGSTLDYIYSAVNQIAQRCEYSDTDSSSAHCNDIYGCLVNGSSRCFGYASAVKYMLDAEGIPNFIATGMSGGDRHAWNMVNVGGTWIVVDATYSRDMMQKQRASSLDECQDAKLYCSHTMENLNDNLLNSPYQPEQETVALLGM